MVLIGMFHVGGLRSDNQETPYAQSSDRSGVYPVWVRASSVEGRIS